MSEPKTNKPWLLLLVLSIALNIGLFGYLLGSANQDRGVPVQAPPNATIGHFLRSLPPERRAEIKPAMRTHFKQLRPSIRAHRQAHRHLQKVVSGDPLDKLALRNALEQMGNLDTTHRSAQADSLAELISQLSPSERQALAQAMKRPFPRGRGLRHQAPKEAT